MLVPADALCIVLILLILEVGVLYHAAKVAPTKTRPHASPDGSPDQAKRIGAIALANSGLWADRRVGGSGGDRHGH
ncbi:MAG: hypothetical protein SNJ57_02860 [Cyanobacteriota bacterium]